MTEHAYPDPWPAPVASRPLNATVTIPGSKSLSNRFLILAALGTKPVTLRGLLRSRDTELMMDALRTLGVHCETAPNVETTVTVTPPADGHFHGSDTVYCGLAGTVMRFVPGLVLFADGPVHFDGDEQAYQRPMGPILDGLEQLGATIAYEGETGRLPFTITPPQYTSIDGQRRHVAIDSSSSSQFISGLLLIGSRLPGGLDLTHTGKHLPSMPHIRMTMHDVEAAGGHISMPQPGHWLVEPASLTLPAGVTVEPDLSNAAPFLGAAMIASGTVSIPNWPYTTTQPGGLLPGILQQMGATVTLDGIAFDEASRRADADPRGYAHRSGTLTLTGDGNITGLGDADLSAAGEIAPSIAALAALADTPSAFHGIAHLRGHETNRLAALVTEIRRIGGQAEELPDGLSIGAVPRTSLHAAVMETYADHRMATFAAMIGLAVPGIEIRNIATTRKTIPDFPGMWTDMLAQH
ncbi:3-phosphoshikimate 1-carboxyvinyltransferase [Bifidobacterium thermophilum]|uniref:3-phosphoshikimate 1-carboxyvinyltransferase n=1 Tax=Bifidobacterium thermophilum TaxID=33905 RepID=UPI0039967851